MESLKNITQAFMKKKKKEEQKEKKEKKNKEKEKKGLRKNQQLKN